MALVKARHGIKPSLKAVIYEDIKGINNKTKYPNLS